MEKITKGDYEVTLDNSALTAVVLELFDKLLELESRISQLESGKLEHA